MAASTESPSKLTTLPKPKLVFSLYDFSVSVLKNGKVKHLKDVDGHTKIPIFISFAEKHILVGSAARDMMKTKPTCVLYDILKLSLNDSLPSAHKYKNFKLFKDEKYETMIEFDSFLGRKTAYLPFLVALILKHIMDMVHSNTGTRPTEYEVSFVGFTPTENLISIFTKAADLKNIKLSFI